MQKDEFTRVTTFFHALLAQNTSVGYLSYPCTLTGAPPSKPTKNLSAGYSKMYSQQLPHAPLINRLLSVSFPCCYLFSSSYIYAHYSDFTATAAKDSTVTINPDYKQLSASCQSLSLFEGISYAFL